MREFADSMTAGVAVLTRQLSPSQDLIYATASYARKNERWPNDYAELTNFVSQSNGYLYLKHYDEVQMTRTPEGDLCIEYIAYGRTNWIGFSHKELPALLTP